MAVNVVQNALSSRRLNRWLPWIAGAVLAAGVIAFLVAYLGNTGDTKERASVVDLKKVGSRWLVNYCQPQSSARLPTPS
jgi:hypothetical protein